jgi:hypothetical protein
MNDQPEISTGSAGKVVFARVLGHDNGSADHDARRAKILKECGLENEAVLPSLFPQLTLMAREALDSVTSLEDIAVWPGFCGEDICTEGVDYEALRVGSLLRAGNALLLVIRKGKNCGGKCSVSQKTLDCPLSVSWMSAWVIRDGDIRIEDSVNVVFAEGDPVSALSAA